MNASSDQKRVLYLVVNVELRMSLGKVLAQVSHAATKIALDAVFGEGLVRVPDPRGPDFIRVERRDGHESDFVRWMNESYTKVLLAGKQKDMERLEAAGFVAIRDNGLTEVPPNSLTVVGLPPMTKEAARPHIKRLQVLKTSDLF